MLPLLHRHTSLPLIVAFLIVAVTPLRGEDVSVEKVFATVPFDQWVEQGQVTAVRWNVTVQSVGLTGDQRLGAYIHVELAQRKLVKFSQGDRVTLLLQVSDAGGRSFRDCKLLNLEDVKPLFKKGIIEVSWYLLVLPGDYKVTLVLVDALNGKHNLKRLPLHVKRLRNDPLPESWTGLPAVEFPDTELKTPDSLYHLGITGRLHLPVTPRRVVRMEVLVDVTESDLFLGSRQARAYYGSYLREAMRLLQLLSQISLERGSLSVAMLDLHREEVIFKQDDVKELDWPRAWSAVAPKAKTGTIDARELAKQREGPTFFQDELLRRLSLPHAGQAEGDDTVHVFLIIGSHMDYYSLQGFPHLPPGSEKRCVVYFLQVDLLNEAYAKVAVDNMRKMLAPLPLRVFQVGGIQSRSAKSIRHALAKILEEVGKM
jgi:hypothetical protein